MKIAWLNNYIAPYRYTTFRSLQKKINVKFFISALTEPNRKWSINNSGIDYTVQKNLTIHGKYSGKLGFKENLYIQIPYSTIFDMALFKPDVIVSLEFGFRTIMAIAYKMLAKSTLIIVHADISDHTEEHRDSFRLKVKKVLDRFIDGYIVNGKGGERFLERLGTKNKIFKIPYTTDISIFQKYDSDYRESVSILYVGRLEEIKGVRVFLKGIIEISKKLPDIDLEFGIIGDGSQIGEIEELSSQSNIKLRFHGSLEYDLLAPVMSQYSYLVLPSFSDTWGLVVNEALAVGMPVIGSKYAQACEELLIDGYNGWVYDPKDQKSLEEVLSKISFLDEKSYEAMSVNAKKSISQVTPEFVSDKMRDAIMEIANDIKK